VLNIMTIDLYQLMIGIGLAVLTVVCCLIMLSGWFFYLQTKLRRSRKVDGRLHKLPLISPGLGRAGPGSAVDLCVGTRGGS
jgi:hypothetical protein